MKIVSLLSLVFAVGFCVAVSANEKVAPVIAEATEVVPAPATEQVEEAPVEGEEAPAAE